MAMDIHKKEAFAYFISAEYNLSMKKLFAIIILIAVFAVFFTACTTDPPSDGGENGEVTDGEEEEMERIKTVVGDTVFFAALADTAAAEQFRDLLPMDIVMSELGGNEKYFYMDESLSASPSRIDRIEAGDVMLWGDDCIVIFYESFHTSYSYTRIAKIENASGLKEAAGRGSVRVVFENLVAGAEK